MWNAGHFRFDTNTLNNTVLYSQHPTDQTMESLSERMSADMQLTDELKNLTRCGLATHICAINQVIIVQVNGFVAVRSQAIIWPITELFSTRPFRKNCGDVLIKGKKFYMKKINLKMSCVKGHPFCSDLKLINKSPILQVAKKFCYVMRLVWDYLIGTGVFNWPYVFTSVLILFWWAHCGRFAL